MNPYDPIVHHHRPTNGGGGGEQPAAARPAVVVVPPSHPNHNNRNNNNPHHETRMICGHPPMRRLLTVVIHSIAEASNPNNRDNDHPNHHSINHRNNDDVEELPPSDQVDSSSTSSPMLPPSLTYKTDRMESEFIARRKLLDWGFDPEDVSKSSNEWFSSRHVEQSNISYCKRQSRPMIIFSQLGDLPMMKYIFQHSTLSNPLEELTMTDEHELFPLYTAISKPHSEEHILALCSWLYEMGANIHQQVGYEWSCLSRACLLGYEGVAKWLLSNGALLTTTTTTTSSVVAAAVDGEDNTTTTTSTTTMTVFDEQMAKMDLPPSSCYGHEGALVRHVADRVHRKIFQWAKEICSIRTSFMVFLSGTIILTNTTTTHTDPHSHPRRRDPFKMIQQHLMNYGHYSEEAVSFFLTDVSKEKMEEFLRLSASPLNILNGYSGVLELISQYVGVETRSKILCTATGLVQHEKWWNLDVPIQSMWA